MRGLEASVRTGDGPGPDRHKGEPAAGVAPRAAEAGEGPGVERQVVVAAGGVGLPDLDHRVRHGLSGAIVERALDPHGLRVIRRDQLGAVSVEERVVEEGAYRLGGRDLGAHLWFSMGIAFLPSSTISKR